MAEMGFSSIVILRPRWGAPPMAGCCHFGLVSRDKSASSAHWSRAGSNTGALHVCERRNFGWSPKTDMAPELRNSPRKTSKFLAMATLIVEEAPVGLDLASLKKDVLSVVAGLDRGLLASKEDVSAADNAARTLEAAGGAVEFPDELEKLQGKWRLIYSSAFASGNLGGTRPGPPAGQFPLTLGQVFQRIDTLSQELDNIVDLRFNLFWPLPVLEVTATLAHKFELTGKTGIRIIFEKTRLKAGGNLSELPPVDLPKLPEFLRPSSNSRSGQFEVTFLDEDFRITRGDRGELRIFVKL
ncbi:hypothetical protein O6H91_04G104100 [Diphasiastrum complanatum]|uniref:Uncharacterized protein n=1 Tax=Diphasiastrum complanatum TaxID=34168 RepID=A0ACC2E0I6_DIPCM|nr:hypothetical protein O6H91_04G104100 [Diphasiastrum complanatum]